MSRSEELKENLSLIYKSWTDKDLDNYIEDLKEEIKQDFKQEVLRLIKKTNCKCGRCNLRLKELKKIL